MVLLGVILRFHHDLRNREQSDEGDDEVDTAHQPIASKGKAGSTANIVHADGGHKQADTGADQAFENAVIGNARNDRQAEYSQSKIFSRAKQQRDLCDLRSQKQQSHSTDQATDGRSEQRHLQRLERLSLRGHGIAVKQRCRIGGGAGSIDQNRGNGAAVSAAAVDSQQHQNRHGGIHAVGERDAKNNTEVRGQAGNGTNHDTDSQAKRNNQKVLPLHQDLQST